MAKNNKEQNTPEVTVEQLVTTILERAWADRASDIHIAPLTNSMNIRFRIDGALQEKWSFPINDIEYIQNRIKILANLDITGRNKPQEGHFQIMVNVADATANSQAKEEKEISRAGEELQPFIPPKKVSALEKDFPVRNSSSAPKGQRMLDVRVSFFPIVNGEVSVLRLLNRGDTLISLENLGMDDNTLSTIKKLIIKNYGMLLVTGPSGAGKTTTLYSLLRELESPEKNIITLEDPVEYHFEGIRQSQMKPEQGYTFAVGMRSILRQDPDIIMIGEIRDPDTAEHAIQASLVGRVVFSTIHSNSTAGTIARLIDMNIERSLIAYALNGVISQRLVRKICNSCKISYTPPQEYLKYFGLEKIEHKFMKGQGCATCNKSGYLGRVGIFEVLELDEKMRSLIIERVPINVLQEYAEKTKMKTLKNDITDKVLAGITTLEEAVKVA